jgi:hypothetical protein
LSTRQTAANESMTIVTFKHLAVQNPLKSKEAGCPKFDDIEICEIRFAGNREKVGHFPAHEICRTERDMEGNVNELTYAMLYNKEYLAFKAGSSQAISGTPTSELPFLSQGKRLELKALNIHTCEALAAVDGNNLKMLGMGGRELKNQAQAYLDKAAEGASAASMATRLAALEEQNKRLQARLAGAPATEAADEPLAAPEDPNASPFFAMGSEDIKLWIAEATGSRPKGNPSHATLVAQADAVNADLKAKREQSAA